MTLTDSDYQRLSKLRNLIRSVANGHGTRNGDVFSMCDQIRFEHTGQRGRQDCDACKAELITEVHIALTEYEALHSSKRQDPTSGNEG